MNFFKLFTGSVALFALCACDGNEFTLSFNTQNAPQQTYFLESSLNAILPAMDSVSATPEAMNTHLEVRATNSLLTAYDDGSAKNISSSRWVKTVPSATPLSKIP